MIGEDNNLRRHRRDEEPENNHHLRLRNILNILFMIGAVVGVLLYIYSDTTVGTIVVLTAMGIKFVECSLRLIR